MVDKGPSPHARGAPRQSAARAPSPQDHPPMRGEHTPAPSHLEAAGGTIPACAGSTPSRPGSGSASRDHPRMRGEHTCGDWAGETCRGPSPHARGALRPTLLPVHHTGTIPACAGSTPSARGRSCSARDHPRMRGEHRLRYRPLTPPAGPSPHARGAHVRRRAGVPVPGTIPACAGSTSSRGCARLRARDHPRMRGEHHKVSLPSG